MEELNPVATSAEASPTIIELLRNSLGKLGYTQLTRIDCSAEGDEVVLSGELDSFYLKQVAQSVAIKVPGVRNVKNLIHVN